MNESGNALAVVNYNPAAQDYIFYQSSDGLYANITNILSQNTINMAVIFDLQPIDLMEAIHDHMILGDLAQNVTSLPPSESSLGLGWKVPTGIK